MQLDISPTLSAVADEVTGGAALLTAAGAPVPRWFRGAAARYTSSALQEVTALGYQIAAFSINGDQGAALDAAVVRIGRMQDCACASH